MYQLEDFGLARTQQEDSDHSSETIVVRTLGYVAPEYAESGKHTKGPMFIPSGWCCYS